MDVHPLDAVLRHFADLDDPRRHNVVYSLPQLLTLVLMAGLAGADDYDAVADWVGHRLDWLGDLLGLPARTKAAARRTSIARRRMTPFPADTDLTLAAGVHLRRHLTQDLGKPTLEARCAQSAETASLLRSFVMKPFFGLQMQVLMVNADGRPAAPPPFQVHMTFDEAAHWLGRIHDAGVKHVHTQSTGWNVRGHDGLWPTKFPVERRVGGEQGLRRMIGQGHELGFTMSLHDNFACSMLESPDHRDDWVRHDEHGQPHVNGFWGGGYKCIRLGRRVPDAWIENQLARTRALGISGSYYIDGIGNPLYIDYHPTDPGTRTQYAQGINKFLSHAKHTFGSVATECGFMYCCLVPDLIATHGSVWHAERCDPDWPITSMITRTTPLWQIAMSGLIMAESQHLNWPSLMECLLFAEHPRDEWSTRPGMMPIIDDERIARQKAIYDLALDHYGHLQLEPIIDYHREGERVMTTFDGGTTVEADFAEQTLVINSQQVHCPDALLDAPTPTHA
ncbi:MAG: DUF5696 domain-containing protein [Phycisphaeraceae bacterium]